jgi:hypothetical protein
MSGDKCTRCGYQITEEDVLCDEGELVGGLCLECFDDDKNAYYDALATRTKSKALKGFVFSEPKSGFARVAERVASGKPWADFLRASNDVDMQGK